MAKALKFDTNTMWVQLTDGRTLGIPLAWFPRLLHASPEQRERYEISGGGTGLHWEEIDEDISVAGLLITTNAFPARTSTPNASLERTRWASQSQCLELSLAC